MIIVGRRIEQTIASRPKDKRFGWNCRHSHSFLVAVETFATKPCLSNPQQERLMTYPSQLYLYYREHRLSIVCWLLATIQLSHRKLIGGSITTSSTMQWSWVKYKIIGDFVCMLFTDILQEYYFLDKEVSQLYCSSKKQDYLLCFSLMIVGIVPSSSSSLNPLIAGPAFD